MNHSEYCTTVCKGKCCSLRDYETAAIKWTCPNLEDGKCKIYHLWADQGTCGKYFPEVNNVPMRIEEAIRSNALPILVEKQCCYAHPEVLNGN